MRQCADCKQVLPAQMGRPRQRCERCAHARQLARWRERDRDRRLAGVLLSRPADPDLTGLDLPRGDSVRSGFEVAEHDLPADVRRSLRDRGLL